MFIAYGRLFVRPTAPPSVSIIFPWIEEWIRGIFDQAWQLFVEVRVSIRAATPTDAELHEEAAVFPTAAGQKEHSVYVPNARQFFGEREL